MTQTTSPALTFTTADWARDSSAFDPSAICRTVEFEGATYTLRNRIPGWPMTIYDRKGYVGIALWENWSEVITQIRRHRTREAQKSKEVAPYGWVITRGGKRVPMPANESTI